MTASASWAISPRVDGFWRAWRADGIPLGVYPTRDEARAAVIKAGRPS